MTASTLLHWQVLSKELGTVQTGTVKVDPARKFKCTPAARVYVAKKSELENESLCSGKDSIPLYMYSSTVGILLSKSI